MFMLIVFILAYNMAAAAFLNSTHIGKRPLLGVVGCIDDGDTLSRVVDGVAKNKEIIAFAFNGMGGMWMVMAENMAAQLDHIGFGHWVAIGSGESDCVSFSLQVSGASCVWTLITKERRGNQDLWIQRYHVTNRLAQSGLNVLLTDLDVMFFRDPYPELNARRADLSHLSDGMANGGLFYMRGDRPGNAAQWAHTNVVDVALRSLDVLEREGVYIGHYMDQALLADALRNAACNGSALNVKSMWASASPESRAHPFWSARVTGGLTAAEMCQLPWACPPKTRVVKLETFAGIEIEEIERRKTDDHNWRAYKEKFLTRVAVDSYLLNVPLDAGIFPGGEAYTQPAVYEKAPVWLFGSGNEALAGWRTSAVVHLVAAGANWHGGERVYHGRRAVMVANGAWHSRHLSWDNLPLRRGFLQVDPALAQLPPNASKAEVGRLLVRIISAAAQADRIAVLPDFDCALPWIKREPWAKGGVFDASVILYRKQCYPAPATSCGHDVAIGGYELKALHSLSNNVTTLHAWPERESPIPVACAEYESRPRLCVPFC